MADLLTGKRALIVGVANKRSLAWGIAKALHREGCSLAFTYQNDRLRGNVEDLAHSLSTDSLLFPLDVSRDEEISQLAKDLGKRWDSLDILVHSVAFAKREELEGTFLDTSREGFALATDISAYSLVALTRAHLPLLQAAGEASVITLSYLGAVRAVPNYNVMGVAKAALESSVRYLARDLGPLSIRVNAISAGPVKTLAASGIKNVSTLIEHANEISPLRRPITIDDVGNAALFMASPLSQAITGTILYVDGGYHIQAV